MPTAGDMIPGGMSGLAQKVAALEREVRELRAARRGEATSISGGQYSLITPAGVRVFGVGQWPTGNYGTELRRDDGTLAVSVSGHDDLDGNMIQISSRDGHVIVADDQYADGWLGRPWVPVPMAAPYDVTAGSWVLTHIGDWWAQHAVLDLHASVYAPAATTGQIRFRIVVNGATILTSSVASATNTTTSLSYRATRTDLAGIQHGTRVQVLLECQRTAGAGVVTSLCNAVMGSDTNAASEA